MRKLLLSLLLALLPTLASAQSITTTVCPGAGCNTYSVDGQGTIGFQVTGTWSGTLTFSASVDGTNFVTILVAPSSSTTGVSTTTANGAWQASIAGYAKFRVAFTSWVSGTAVVSQRTTAAKSGGSGGTGGGSNPFDQTLNTTSAVEFTGLTFDENTGITFNGPSTPIYAKTGRVGSATSVDITSPVDDWVIFDISNYADIYFSPTGGVNLDWGAPTVYFNPNGESTFSNQGLHVEGGFISGVNKLALNINTNTDAIAAQVAQGGNIGVTVANSITSAQALGTIATINSGTISTELYNSHLVTTLNNASIVTGSLWGVRNIFNLNSTSQSGDIQAYNYDINKAAGATINGHAYGYWADNLNSLTAGSSYPFWYAGGGGDCNVGGVTRINQFGIFAYYNPCFTTYTPDLANFERIILRFGDTGVFGVDNRAYLGVEVGGTGTNRAVNLIGANYSITSTLTPGITDTTANSCGTGTQTIVGNDNVGKVTVIGSSGTSCTVTFATQFTNAPTCLAVNEGAGTAATRAIATVSTVIISGTFSQNDVIAYMCMGR